MRRLRISKLYAIVSLLNILFLVLITGCAADVWNYPLPETSKRNKIEVLKIWGSPNKIEMETGKLKYGADEVWIYKIEDDPSLVEERLYFKSGVLIKREGITRDSL